MSRSVANDDTRTRKHRRNATYRCVIINRKKRILCQGSCSVKHKKYTAYSRHLDIPVLYCISPNYCCRFSFGVSISEEWKFFDFMMWGLVIFGGTFRRINFLFDILIRHQKGGTKIKDYWSRSRVCASWLYWKWEDGVMVMKLVFYSIALMLAIMLGSFSWRDNILCKGGEGWASFQKGDRGIGVSKKLVCIFDQLSHSLLRLGGAKYPKH